MSTYTKEQEEAREIVAWLTIHDIEPPMELLKLAVDRGFISGVMKDFI